MKKKLSGVFAVILALVMLLSAVPFAVSAAETATVNGETVNVGDTVTVKWKLTAANYAVNAQFGVTYPSDILELTDTDKASVLPVFAQKGYSDVVFGDGAVNVVATNASSTDADLYDFRSGDYICVLNFTVRKAGTADVALNTEFIGGKNSQGISGDEVALVENNTAANGAVLAEEIVKEEEVFENLTINDELVVNIGDKVTYEVLVDVNAKLVDLQGIINYDSEYLTLDKVTFPVIKTMESNTEIADEINFAFTRPEEPYAVSGETVVVRVQFTAAKNGKTTVSHEISVISGFNESDPENDIDLINGSVKADIEGRLIKGVVEDPEPPVDILYGDVDFNKTVDAADATLVLQHYAGIITLEEDAVVVGDVDESGELDASDATLILQRYADIIQEFPVEAA